MIEDQPPPLPGEKDIWLLVIEDMKERRVLGIERHKTPLQAHNGRKAIIDAYQESLDQTVYLRQFIEEQQLPIDERPEIIDDHPILFPDVGPLMKALASAMQKAKDLEVGMRGERELLKKYKRISNKIIRLMNSELFGQDSTWADIDNAEKKLEEFEIHIHQLFLGVNPKRI